MGRLFIVEGGSGTGKDTLLRSLAEIGTVVRGVASQNPGDNLSLVEESREVLGDLKLDFSAIMTGDPHVRDDAFSRFIEISRIQLYEALILRDLGNDVYMNRSPISTEGYIELARRIIATRNLDDANKWAERMGKKNSTLLDVLLSSVDGVVILDKMYSVGGEREGVRAVQDTEVRLISELAKGACFEREVPFLVLDTNSLSVEEEATKVQEFFGLPKKFEA